MYDNPNRHTYTFPAQDAGAGSVTAKIFGPKGKEGRVYDYGFVNVTEAFTANTLPANVSVGKSGDLDAYGDELSMGTTAIGGGKTLRSTYGTTAEITPFLPATIPADTEVVITATAPTGGTPAGIGTLMVVIDWAW